MVSSSIMSPTPQVIIMGHSLVHLFHLFLVLSTERSVRLDLNLYRSAYVNYYGVGSRTVDELNKFDHSVVGRFRI